MGVQYDFSVISMILRDLMGIFVGSCDDVSFPELVSSSPGVGFTLDISNWPLVEL